MAGSLNDTHKQIHCILQHLTLLRPTSFIFKEGMFRVPNVKGSQEIMYYFMNIIDSEKSAKLIKWPLLDKKAESQFRIIIKKFVSEIIEKYPVANLPKIVLSFLMSPGGDRFAHFLLKLSMFVLYRILSLEYGASDMLFLPGKHKNESLFNAKLNLISVLYKSITRRVISDQIKIDSVLSNEFELQCSIELKELEEEIRSCEITLREQTRIAPLSADKKEKLLSNLSNSSPITEWIAEIESERRSVEAMIYVMNKTGADVTSCYNIIKATEENASSQLCVDASTFVLQNNDIYLNNEGKELVTKMKNGKLSLSDFILNLFHLHAQLSQHFKNLRLHNMNTVQPELQKMNAEFQECVVLLSSTENELKETMNKVQKNSNKLEEEVKCKEDPKSLFDLPVMNVPDISEKYLFTRTPVRGTFDSIFKQHNTSFSSVNFDHKLLLTPQLDDTSPRKMNDETSLEYETPLRKGVFKAKSSSTIQKSHPTDLRTLTMSLAKNKKLSSKSQQSTIPRINKASSTATLKSVTKELFEHSADGDRKKVCASLRGTSGYGWSSHNTEFEGFACLPPSPADIEPLPENLLNNSHNGVQQDSFNCSESPKKDVESPVLRICTPDSKKAQEPNTGEKSKGRRKSLNLIIERYKKIRQNMEGYKK